MTLLHPPIPPWCVATPDGLQLLLLSRCAQAEQGPVFVRSLPDNEELLTPMQATPCHGQFPGWLAWRADIAWDRGNPLTLYCFVQARAGGPCWLGSDGEHALAPTEAQNFRVHPHQAPPDWVRSQVFYQVFPDRFAAAGNATDRSGELLHGDAQRPVRQAAWGAPTDPANAATTFYGGNLPGLTQALPYLKNELGVTAIYLNPIFASSSNHRYDTSDYTQVDVHLGGNPALAELRAATEQRGMRLLLDIALNHTGADHPWFDRWGRHTAVGQTPGAAQSADSPYRSHYAWADDGQVVGWKGHASLPVLDFASSAVQQALYAAPDAVLRRWLRPPYAIDGWRLDVIHMLGEGPGALHNAQHVRTIRQAIKAENPQAYVLGEHFAEATRWLQGDMEDGAMNYFGFTHPLRAWLAGYALGGVKTRLATAHFEAALRRAVAAIPYANQLAQFNLLGSHDTSRLLTELAGNEALMKVAATLLFTWPGVPCIYYGDEIGLQGGPDPDCRRCFDWDHGHWKHALFEHFALLAQTRAQRAEWQGGAVLTLALGGDWLAYARFTAQAASVVLVNRGPALDVRVPLAGLPWLPARWSALCGPDAQSVGTELRAHLPAGGQAVWLGE